MKRIRIVDKRRFAAFCASVLLVFTGIICAVCAAAKDCAEQERDYTLVYVGEGDTLWSIVRENCPDKEDIRSIISDIKSVNGMATSTIHPGDAIYVPVY
jgi:hypothetical protein